MQIWLAKSTWDDVTGSWRHRWRRHPSFRWRHSRGRDVTMVTDFQLLIFHFDVKESFSFSSLIFHTAVVVVYWKWLVEFRYKFGTSNFPWHFLLWLFWFFKIHFFFFIIFFSRLFRWLFGGEREREGGGRELLLLLLFTSKVNLRWRNDSSWGNPTSNRLDANKSREKAIKLVEHQRHKIGYGDWGDATFGWYNIASELIERHPRVEFGGRAAAGDVVVVVVVHALVVVVGRVVRPRRRRWGFILERIGFDEDVVLALIVVPELAGFALEPDAELYPVHRGAGRNRDLQGVVWLGQRSTDGGRNRQFKTQFGLCI